MSHLQLPQAKAKEAKVVLSATYAKNDLTTELSAEKVEQVFITNKDLELIMHELKHHTKPNQHILNAHARVKQIFG